MEESARTSGAPPPCSDHHAISPHAKSSRGAPCSTHLRAAGSSGKRPNLNRECRIVSSELKTPELEAKLLARMRMFDFSVKDVEQMVVTWPVDFLPS